MLTMQSTRPIAQRLAKRAQQFIQLLKTDYKKWIFIAVCLLMPSQRAWATYSGFNPGPTTVTDSAGIQYYTGKIDQANATSELTFGLADSVTELRTATISKKGTLTLTIRNNGGTSTNINLIGGQIEYYVTNNGVSRDTTLFNNIAETTAFQYVWNSTAYNTTISGITAPNGTLGRTAQHVGKFGTSYDNDKLKKGIAYNTYIGLNGSQHVFSDSEAYDTVIGNGGQQNINNSSTVSRTTIHAGGEQNISKNSSAYETTVTGVQNVSQLGTAYTTTVTLGGKQTIRKKGWAYNTNIAKGGTQSIEGGGSARDNHIYGTQTVGGEAINNQVYSGGAQLITATASAVGKATNTYINGGAIQEVGGEAISTTVSSGSTQTIVKNVIASVNKAKATDTRIQDRATQIVGGEAISTTIGNWATQTINTGGIATNTTIASNSIQEVSGQAISTTIATGATQSIFSGGSANTTTIDKGATQTIKAGGTAISTTIATGATQTILPGGKAIQTEIQSGNVHHVYGTAITTTIKGTSEQYLYQGAISEYTILEPGSTQTVGDGATAKWTEIKKESAQTVSIGGIAENTTIHSGATQTVNGTANGIIIKSGGTSYINPGAYLDGNVKNDGQLFYSINKDQTRTYTGELTGNGLFEKKGEGVLVFNSMSKDFTGTTVISAGMLKLGDINHPTATLGGNIDVKSGATLRGHGTALGNVVNDGLVQPGGSIGNLTVNRDYTQTKNGTLKIEMTPQKFSKLIVNGKANLGGSLSIIYDYGEYTKGVPYTVISAVKEITGKFDTVTHAITNANGAVLEERVENGVATVDVFFGKEESPVNPDNGGDTPTPNATPANNDKYFVRPTNEAIYPNVSTFSMIDMQQFSDVVMQRRNVYRLYDHQGQANNPFEVKKDGDVWVQSVASHSKHGNAKVSQKGIMLGAERVMGNTNIGMAIAYNNADFSDAKAIGSASTKSSRFAIYAHHEAGKILYSGALSYTRDRIEQNRVVESVGTANNQHRARGTVLDMTAGIPIALNNATVLPYIGLRYSRFNTDGFAEQGVEMRKLMVEAHQLRSTQLNLGAALNKKLGHEGNGGLISLRLGYSRELNRANQSVKVISRSTSEFDAVGNILPRNLLSIGTQIELYPSKSTVISFGGQLSAGSGSFSQTTLNAKIKYSF